MTEKSYPYNLPPWRRQFSLPAPDGQNTATIHEAWELTMSGPTFGKLFIGNEFRIKNCSPTFTWSSDSRYLAVPQWCGIWRRRQRILVLDIIGKKIYESRRKFNFLIFDGFEDGVFLVTDSPLKKEKKLRISMKEIKENYRQKKNLLQGSESVHPIDRK